MNERHLQRFWAQVQKTEECWLWTGYLRNGAYGALWVDGKMRYTHRLSYEMHHGPVPKGMVVCHRCDVPACVRPEHLFIGTDADNMADMRAKKRGSPPPKLCGLANPNATLTDEQVEEVRRLVAGGMKQRDVAKRYGVSQSTVWRLAHGFWRVKPGPAHDELRASDTLFQGAVQG